jgi:nitronate monooxygenase
MGAGVSNWLLARAVSRLGQLGVVSGTALDTILVRRLQDGDPGGAMRRSLARFPLPGVARRILERYHLPQGRAPGRPYKALPLYTLDPPQELLEVTVAANFVEVDLAKAGHRGLVGINLLEKIQMHSLACLYGAMLAGVDYVLMGAGIPRAIPGVLDALSTHAAVSITANVEGAAAGDDYRIDFDPRDFFPHPPGPLGRPKFVAIVASNALALTLTKKASGRVDGFVVEGPTAGGHNAPPRGGKALDAKGEPVYGPRDEVDLAAIRDLGLPFWLAGSYGRPDKLREARDLGAAGIQVGTAFAYCRESGLTEELKAQVLRLSAEGEACVFTDPQASPTGFPFKLARIPGTLSEPDVYAARPRTCNLGYLRTPYKRKDGALGYRCKSDSPAHYARQEGDPSETVGRRCLCNGLMANIGLPQVSPSGRVERPLVTSGDDLGLVHRFRRADLPDYGAGDVLRALLGRVKTPPLRTA